MKAATLPLVLALLLISFGTQGRAEQAYDWTGGAPGYGGTMVLDSNSNPDGTLADVVSVSLTVPAGTFVAYPNPGLDGFDGTQGFSWNPTQITDMAILFDVPLFSVYENFDGTGTNGLSVMAYPISLYTDDSGSWQAAPGGSSSVPDATSTGLLVGVALAGFVFARWLRRTD